MPSAACEGTDCIDDETRVGSRSCCRNSTDEGGGDDGTPNSYKTRQNRRMRTLLGRWSRDPRIAHRNERRATKTATTTVRLPGQSCFSKLSPARITPRKVSPSHASADFASWLSEGRSSAPSVPRAAGSTACDQPWTTRRGSSVPAHASRKRAAMREPASAWSKRAPAKTASLCRCQKNKTASPSRAANARRGGTCVGGGASNTCSMTKRDVAAPLGNGAKVASTSACRDSPRHVTGARAVKDAALAVPDSASARRPAATSVLSSIHCPRNSTRGPAKCGCSSNWSACSTTLPVPSSSGSAHDASAGHRVSKAAMSAVREAPDDFDNIKVHPTPSTMLRRRKGQGMISVLLSACGAAPTIGGGYESTQRVA
jgi:hypothetical protein